MNNSNKRCGYGSGRENWAALNGAWKGDGRSEQRRGNNPNSASGDSQMDQQSQVIA